ncbi:ribonuclease H family protein [Nocardia amikacinitolerans]|uniref:ribonuclease H family protein n=1 Tax=Nocardia amikacinitolerans TaxID=756689 RepID=UPI0020A5213E|nr:ribonuclease H [Nocardia amikacinitolerans]MCP2276674.1 ribonuclease HI [Nocardia amikacinitolerans]
MIIVSTDGSCLRNPGGAIGWAWVNHQGGASRSGGAATGTNQIAELRAVLEAIEAHPGAEPLLIESDSLYAIKCASEWISSWRLNGWRTSTGGAVKNVEIIKQIDRAIASRPGPVRFRWVRGHVGNYFNEMADTLAGEAARKAAASASAAEVDTTELAAVDTPKTTVPLAKTTVPLSVTLAKSAAPQQRNSAPQQKTTGPRASGKAVASAPQTLTLF